MNIRDAMLRVVCTHEYAVQSKYGVSIYWDGEQRKYNVHEENDVDYPDTFFDEDDAEGAVDYFLKITEDDRIARTEEEIENGSPGPLD